MHINSTTQFDWHLAGNMCIYATKHIHHFEDICKNGNWNVLFFFIYHDNEQLWNHPRTTKKMNKDLLRGTKCNACCLPENINGRILKERKRKITVEEKENNKHWRRPLKFIRAYKKKFVLHEKSQNRRRTLSMLGRRKKKLKKEDSRKGVWMVF